MMLGDKIVAIEECCLYIAQDKDTKVPDEVCYRFTDKGYTRVIHNNGVYIFLSRDSRVPEEISSWDSRVLMAPDECDSTGEITDFIHFYATTVKGFSSIAEYMESIPGEVVFVLKHVNKLAKYKDEGLVTNI